MASVLTASLPASLPLMNQIALAQSRCPHFTLFHAEAHMISLACVRVPVRACVVRACMCCTCMVGTPMRQAGREELAAAEKSELAVINSFLPALADEATTRKWVEAAIAESGATSPAMMGKVAASESPPSLPPPSLFCMSLTNPVGTPKIVNLAPWVWVSVLHHFGVVVPPVLWSFRVLNKRQTKGRTKGRIY